MVITATLDQRLRARLLRSRGGNAESLRPAMSHSGDVKRGEGLFDPRIGCVKCHSAAGRGRRDWPDLSGLAEYDRAELIRSVIEPEPDRDGLPAGPARPRGGKVVSGLIRSRRTPNGAGRRRCPVTRSQGRDRGARLSEVSLMPKGHRHADDGRVRRPDQL